MSSEERQRREEEPPREKSPQEELRAESQETEDVSEPVEVGGSEDPGVVEEIADEDHAEKPADKPPLNEEEPSEEVMPSEEEPAIADEELAALAEELETTRRERDEYLDTLRRLKAEFENSRKRYEREKARILETAAEGLVVELLPVLDNLDRALEAEGDIHEGVQAIRDQLVATLGKEGLLPVASDGQPFDPNVHEAVMSQPSEEHEEGTILQTFQRGYLLNGKPIRPAKVVVSKQV